MAARNLNSSGRGGRPGRSLPRRIRRNDHRGAPRPFEVPAGEYVLVLLFVLLEFE